MNNTGLTHGMKKYIMKQPDMTDEMLFMISK
jgi:hypothetical protein